MRIVKSSAVLALVGLLAHAGCAIPEEDEEMFDETTEELRKQCGLGPTVPGLDVSKYQGDVDFEKVRASGQRWVIIRSNDGDYVDPMFVTNYKKAKQAGLVVGAYMFYRVKLEHQRPGVQAGIMLQKLTEAGYDPKEDLPPTLDVEGASFNLDLDRESIIKGVKATLDKLEARAGRKPIIYTNSAWEEHIGSSSFGDYPLWAAMYYLNGSPESNCPKIAETGARTWTFWQHCKGERGAGQCQRDVPGISGRPDQNVFNGTLEQFMAFVRGDGGPAAGGCHSATLGRVVVENTCVQSRSDGKWYQCSDGKWLVRSTVAAACVSEHPL